MAWSVVVCCAALACDFFWQKETSSALTHAGAHLDLSAFSSWEVCFQCPAHTLSRWKWHLGILCHFSAVFSSLCFLGKILMVLMMSFLPLGDVTWKTWLDLSHSSLSWEEGHTVDSPFLNTVHQGFFLINKLKWALSILYVLNSLCLTVICLIEQELASLGLDRLKSALLALGLKCGGYGAVFVEFLSVSEVFLYHISVWDSCVVISVVLELP